MSGIEESKLTEELSAERRIMNAIRSLRYGSVEVVIHDSRIVQVERREKIRFDPANNPGACRLEK